MMTGEQTIVVTGMGVVSAVGLDLDTFFSALLERRSGARRVQRLADEGLRHDVAAVVEREPVLERLADRERELPWASAMAVLAIRSALADAGLAPVVGDMPLFAACSIGSPATLERPDNVWVELDPTDPASVCRYSQGLVVAAAAGAVGARGSLSCMVSTCAAGNYALGAALDALCDGRATRAVAGGVEELSVLAYTGFDQIRALGDVCRPFDQNRNGLLFGEGAAFLVLETLDAAEARGARCYAQLLGVGYSNDAHHLVAPDPKGAGAAAALRRVLVETGVESHQVGYVNAHGTATALNDEAEASSLYEVFGAAARTLPVSSTKGATGHTLGAASATEAIATVLALHRGLLPPTTGLEQPDPQLGLNVIEREPLQVEVDVALSSGFGFGGNNAVLAVARSPRKTRRLARRDVFIQSGAALVGDRFGLAQVWDQVTQARQISGDREVTFEPAAVLGKKGLRHVDRSALLLASALEIDLPGWPEVDKLRAGAVFGSAFPAYTSVIGILRSMQKGGAKSVNPMLVPFATSNCAPSWWLMRRRITGYNGSVGSGMCAGLDAILLAAWQVRRGRIDAAVAGGVEAKTHELWQGLRRLGWIDGSLSEAVGAVVLSSDAAGAWCRLAGSGTAFDPDDPDSALGRAVDEALFASGRSGVDLAVAGRTPRVDVPATELLTLEPFLGETLGASGALTVLIGAMCAARGKAPAASVLALARSPEGYASAAVLEALSLPPSE